MEFLSDPEERVCRVHGLNICIACALFDEEHGRSVAMTALLNNVSSFHLRRGWVVSTVLFLSRRNLRLNSDAVGMDNSIPIPWVIVLLVPLACLALYREA